MHIGWKLRHLARWHPERIAIVDDVGSWTYQEFHRRLARFGNAMAGLGLARGDRVALILPDIREYLEVDYGTMAAGFVRVPLDPRLTARETAAMLRHAGASALVIHAGFAEKLEAVTTEVGGLRHLISVGGPLPGATEYEPLLQAASDAALPNGSPSDLAALNFSGGTTGAPKAAMLQHRQLMTVTQNTIQAFEITPACRFLNVRPLWPIAQVILMSYLMGGATVVLGGRFEAEGLAPLIDQSGSTRTSLVPTHLARLTEQLKPDDLRLSRLEAIHIGGSRIPTALFERTLDTIGPKIGVLYGMTEAPIASYLHPRMLDCDGDRQRQLMESVGRELFGYRIAVNASTGVTTESGTEGEVLIRGDNVMAGYWQNEDATRAALDHGALRTGDLGIFDGEGNLYIVGRLKDVIRSGSSSVLPTEVEDVVASHPAVREVAVLGLPDVEWGEVVTAFVVLRPGMVASETEIIEHCRARLAGYKKPRTIRFMESLPRSHYGKVMQAQLLAMATKRGV